MSESWKNRNGNFPVVMISGGFDPIHLGHLKYIIEASNINDGFVMLVAVVNGDGFLHRKKHYNFMSEYERAEIVDHIRGVDYTVIWDDGTQFVDGALRLIKPSIFAKGGDRSDIGSMPKTEIDTCQELDIEVRFGIGGKQKLNSSSELVENFKKIQNAIDDF